MRSISEAEGGHFGISLDVLIESARDFKELMKGLRGGPGTRGFRPVNRGGGPEDRD
jgi:hypothetical protein